MCSAACRRDQRPSQSITSRHPQWLHKHNAHIGTAVESCPKIITETVCQSRLLRHRSVPCRAYRTRAAFSRCAPTSAVETMSTMPSAAIERDAGLLSESVDSVARLKRIDCRASMTKLVLMATTQRCGEYSGPGTM